MGVWTHSLKTPLDDCCGDFILKESGYEPSFIFLVDCKINLKVCRTKEG